MPRQARLDLPGLLQHVMVRGIEKRDIFLDDADRDYFVLRLSQLLTETDTECLAWVLMPNHFHLLLRPKEQTLALLMRRLLTGYAVRFNLRYHRSGHLFQNRYQSRVCQEDAYLLELVRYIHLNPLRAGIVQQIEDLDRYHWSGHTVLLGEWDLPGQNRQEVFAYFSQNESEARRRYREFLKEGISQRREEEPIESSLEDAGLPMGSPEDQEHDQRILGNREFLVQVRQMKDDLKVGALRMPIEDLVERVAGVLQLESVEIKSNKRNREVADARGIISYLAVRVIGWNGAELAEALHMTRSGVSEAAERGNLLVRKNPAMMKIIES